MRAALNHRTSLRRLAALSLALALAACATVPSRVAVELPVLQLPPSALGRSMALQQRLEFVFGREQRELDALLEVDAQQVRLAVQALGRSGVTLVWDGTTLQQTRADWLPATVRGERVLDDLQFVHWPVEAIGSALPVGWAVDEAANGTRVLRQGGEVWLRATHRAANTVELENRAEGYRLVVHSVALLDASP